MGYAHIDNLYKNQLILMFRECWAMEKIHGTSAHITWKDGSLHFASGGEKHERFIKLFTSEALVAAFQEMGHETVTIFGEAYGGSQQAQSHRYGKELRFVAFDVRVGETWLAIPNAHDVVQKLGLEFVFYRRVPTDLAHLDAERDAPSEQARRNGVEGDQSREGVVLRPILEATVNGSRVVAKHKRDEERETKSPRKVVDPAKLEVLVQADAIAEEWVTPTRLEHVLDKLGAVGVEQMREIIVAMVEDVFREGAGEIIDSKEARVAVGKRTAFLFKERLQKALRA